MLDNIIQAYVHLFARKRFEKLNKLLFKLSLRGLGILNHETSIISGEQSFLMKTMPGRKGVLIDVGANKGNYSKEALRYNPTMTSYAIEPHPLTFKQLLENTKDNSTIIPINKGLASSAGRLQLFDYSDKDGSSHASLFKDVITEIHAAGRAVAHDIEVTTIDDLVDSEKICEIALLKIDTEGNELDILNGARETLSRNIIKIIHFEFNEMNIASRANFRDFWKLLDNYKLYRLLPQEMLEIESYNTLTCEIYAYQNIVAILKE